MNILNLILVSSYYTILCNGLTTPGYNRGVTSFISSSTKKYQLNNNKRQVVRTTDTLQDNQNKVKNIYLSTLLFAKEKNDIMLSDDFDGNDDVDDESIDLSKEVLNDFDYILFKERQAEISALGGDPAFFTPSDLQAEEEDEEEEEENLSDSSFSFMSSLSQMQGIEQITKTIQKYETNPIPPAPETDSEPVKSFVTYDDDDDDYYDLDFIGGDPGFLIDEDSEEKKDEGDFLWDGEVDEDAHLDL